MRKDIHIDVKVINLKSGDVEQSHAINYSNFNGRKFLDRLMVWAVDHEKGVTIALDTAKAAG